MGDEEDRFEGTNINDVSRVVEKENDALAKNKKAKLSENSVVGMVSSGNVSVSSSSCWEKSPIKSPLNVSDGEIAETGK